MTSPHPVRTALAVLLLALAVAVGAHPGAASAQGAEEPVAAEDLAARPGRLLVVSVPGIEWGDLERNELPALEAFLADAAVADLAPRSVFARSGPGDASLTISGGSRATTDRSVDGQVLAVTEESAGSAAGDIYARRTGEEPTGPFVSLTWPSLVRANAAQPYDTELGSLTETLAAAGVSVAAIGNADGVDAVGDSYERQVGLAVADATGQVPGGSLGKDLLVDDSTEAFGVRLDPDEVMAAFGDAWSAAEPDPAAGDAGGVVVVEASDLARTLRYRPIVDFERYSDLWLESLESTDALLSRLLAEVDPERDTVLVVAPYNKRGDRDLTLVGLRGPGIDPGYLRSASTQRAGFLTLVDVAPTILDVFGVDRPVEMEGRPAVVSATDDGPTERMDHLIALNAASRFRERLLTPTTTLVVLAFAVVLAGAIAAHANGWGGRVRGVIALGGIATLAVLPASYLARIFALEDRGGGFYWTFLLVVAIGFAVAATAVARRRGRPRGALIAVLVLVGGVLALDVMTGSNLSLSAAFGYSATGNSRLYGISNYSYGQLAAAACLVSAWLVLRRPRWQGQALGIGAMCFTLLVLGVPIWGSDVGGVLAFTPAVAAFAMLVTDRRIKLTTALWGVLATGLVLVAFGFLDLARDPSNRGHLGRLFERIGAEGLEPLVSVSQRKLEANLQVSTSSLWVLAIPLGIAFWVFLRRYPGRPYDRMVAGFPTLSAGLVATLVAAVLGSALNDSGAIIGGVMSLVTFTSLAVLLVQDEGEPQVADDDSEDLEPVHVGGDAAG